MDITVQKHHPFTLAHAHLGGMQFRPTPVTHIYNTLLLELECPINITLQSTTTLFLKKYKWTMRF